MAPEIDRYGAIVLGELAYMGLPKLRALGEGVQEDQR
jgi:hypothetical protein